MQRPPRPAHRPAVVLCGPMGAGKSSVGLALARRWSLVMRDTDDDIEQTEGRTIGEIFRTDGEPRFREIEHEAVTRALLDHTGVLALGGGSVLHPGTQEALAGYVADGGAVVFLDVSVGLVGPRVGLDGSRPLLTGDPVQRWTDILTRRRPVYEQVATLHVLTDGKTPDEVAAEIERRLEQAAPTPAHHTSHAPPQDGAGP